MSELARTNALDALAFAKGAALELLSDIPDDQATFQPVPQANHALWIAGHLAWSTDAIFGATSDGAGGGGVPADWEQLFGMGSVPVADPSGYPAFAETRAVLERVCDAFSVWLREVPAAQLADPAPERLKRFASTRAGAVHGAAMHMCVHAGQVTLIRKALGFQPKFG